MVSIKIKGETSTLEADLDPTKLLPGTEVDSKQIDSKIDRQ